jgi:hypothetical protein
VQKEEGTTRKWMLLVISALSKQGSWRKTSEINALNVTSARDVLQFSILTSPEGGFTLSFHPILSSLFQCTFWGKMQFR